MAKQPPKRSGRPATRPLTTLGHWIFAHGWTIRRFAEHLATLAADAGVHPNQIPGYGSFREIVVGEYWPTAELMLVVRFATDGAIDVQHWVRDRADRGVTTRHTSHGT